MIAPTIHDCLFSDHAALRVLVFNYSVLSGPSNNLPSRFHGLRSMNSLKRRRSLSRSMMKTVSLLIERYDVFCSFLSTVSLMWATSTGEQCCKECPWFSFLEIVNAFLDIELESATGMGCSAGWCTHRNCTCQRNSHTTRFLWRAQLGKAGNSVSQTQEGTPGFGWSNYSFQDASPGDSNSSTLSFPSVLWTASKRIQISIHWKWLHIIIWELSRTTKSLR